MEHNAQASLMDKAKQVLQKGIIILLNFSLINFKIF